MEILLAFIAGLVVAGVVALVVVRILMKNAKQNIEQVRLDADKRIQDIDSRNNKSFEELNTRYDKELKELNVRRDKELEELNARHDKAITAERERYEQALTTMKEQLTNATNEMLKQRQAELQQANSANMKQIVDPLKETIQKMETAIKENKSTQETSTAAIKEKIATLVSTTMKVSDSADRLSNALTAENKIQGNWGEQKIEALLNAIGLEPGVEYDAQEYLRDASGKIIVSDDTSHRMQPDIILHLDETRDLIIDSKVSLNAFIDYTNAETDQDRELALSAHLRSVKNHVKELSKKNYAAYVKAPRKSVDFVMMFVPVDAALQLALASDQTLWREAMNQGVFIVGEQNLYAALRAVQVTWTSIKQNANNKAICDTAAELVNRVGDLLERVQNMGDKLQAVNKAYGAVYDKAKRGQSVLGSAQKLVKLGAKASSVHALPPADEEENLPELPSTE